MEESFPRGKAAKEEYGEGISRTVIHGIGRDRLFGMGARRDAAPSAASGAADGGRRRNEKSRSKSPSAGVRPRSEGREGGGSKPKERYFESASLTREGPNVNRADELSFKVCRA